MDEVFQITHEARMAVVAIFHECAEKGMTVGQAVEISREYLAYRGLPDVIDPIALATGGKHAIGDQDLRKRIAVSSSKSTI